MINIIKIELYKLYKSKSHIYILLSLLFLLIITYIISYRLGDTRYNYISYLYYLFSINSKLTFPLIVTILFSSVIVDDFNNGTINSLISSSYERDKIYIGKFIACVLIFFPILLLSILAYITILFTYFKTNNYEVFLLYEGNETIIRFLLILLTQVVYLICYSSFITLLSWILQRKSLATLMSLVIITTIILIPDLPHSISDYLFITNSKIYGDIFADKFDIAKVLMNLSINVGTTYVLLILGILTIKNKEFY